MKAGTGGSATSELGEAVSTYFENSPTLVTQKREKSASYLVRTHKSKTLYNTQMDKCLQVADLFSSNICETSDLRIHT